MNKAPFCRTPVLLALSLTLAVSACSTTGASRYSRSSPPPSHDSFVQQEMGQALSSIDQSLQVLVELDRGDEGPRRSTALGMTVAGAAGPNRSPVAMANRASPSTPLGQARADADRNKARQDLATRVRMEWTGEADGLLRELSKRVGFTFAVSGAGRAPVVHVSHANATVEEVLRDVARQVDGTADVRVDPSQRQVSLVYKR